KTPAAHACYSSLPNYFKIANKRVMSDADLRKLPWGLNAPFIYFALIPAYHISGDRRLNEAVQRGLDLALASTDDDVIAAMNLRAISVSLLPVENRPEAADEANRRYKRLGDFPMEMNSLLTMGELEAERGHYDQAESYFQYTLNRARRVESTTWQDV